jgi:N-acetylglutamate synthase-like GNAT family acetyltransferase
VVVETVIDSAVMKSLLVSATMRGRKIGAALVAAARAAAHTRGARRLFALGSLEETGYLTRFGFVAVNLAEARAALGDGVGGDELRSAPVAAWMLDISRDGIIER